MSRQRLIFCTYSSIYSSQVLARLLSDKHIDVVAIVNSTRVIHPNYGFIRGAFQQIKQSGWHYASYLFMVTDLFRYMQPLSKFKTVHALAKQKNIPVWDTLDINNEKSLQFIQRASASYLLAAHFNQLIKTPLLTTKGLQCLNIHPSLLPDYKGVDPVFYTQLDQQKNIGVSLHRMAETFDSGEILSQKKIVWNKPESVFALNKRLFEAGAIIACRWIEQSACNDKINTEAVGDDNTRNRTTKESYTKENQGRYDSWPSSKQGRHFRQMNNTLITPTEYWKSLKLTNSTIDKGTIDSDDMGSGE